MGKLMTMIQELLPIFLFLPVQQILAKQASDFTEQWYGTKSPRLVLIQTALSILQANVEKMCTSKYHQLGKSFKI